MTLLTESRKRPTRSVPITGKQSTHDLPPVILLGGEANALSVARSLGALGVTVYSINVPGSCAARSRYTRSIPVPVRGSTEESWAQFLLGPMAASMHGAVLLACSDDALLVLARYRDALQELYLLDASDPGAQIAMLDKYTTYQHAVAAGVPTPKFWLAEGRDQVLALKDELVFPLLVKPRVSHLFERVFGQKFFVAADFVQLVTAFDSVSAAEVEVLLVEFIPGPDDRLCSYYTYLDENGSPQFHFTKRIIRRFPTGMGGACYHITDWVPELPKLGMALFEQVGLRGLANVEFKLDERDGQYKLIECNARFTAGNCLVAASGFNLAVLVYNRITGRPTPVLNSYALGLRLWDPVRDFWSFRELNKTGRLTWREWIASILHRQTFAYFAWHDPMPALSRVTKPFRRVLGRCFKPAAAK